MKKVNVVAALIEKNGSYLIAQRATGSLKGKWEFPGGKVEKNETEETAIVREIYEELNISVKCEEFVDKIIFEKDDQEITLNLYRCSYLSGEVVLNAHSSYIFVARSLLLTYDLADADRELAKIVVNGE